MIKIMNRDLCEWLESGTDREIVLSVYGRHQRIQLNEGQFHSVVLGDDWTEMSVRALRLLEAVVKKHGG